MQNAAAVVIDSFGNFTRWHSSRLDYSCSCVWFCAMKCTAEVYAVDSAFYPPWDGKMSSNSFTWVTEGGDLSTADWGCLAGFCASLCLQAAYGGRAAGSSGDESTLEACACSRRCTIQIDNLYFLPLCTGVTESLSLHDIYLLCYFAYVRHWLMKTGWYQGWSVWRISWLFMSRFGTTAVCFVWLGFVKNDVKSFLNLEAHNCGPP